MALRAKADQLISLSTKKTNRVPADLTEEQFYDLIEFEPRAIQRTFLSSHARFAAGVWHRRSGKSYSEIVKLLRSSVACPFDNGRYAYTGPTQDQVKDIAWHYLTEIGAKIPGVLAKESKREIWIPQMRGNISRIKLYGVDNPKQRLRGLYLDGAAADEYQDQRETVWTEQMRPMLADANRAGVDLFGYVNQWANFIGTPKGRNQLYRMYRDACIWQAGRAVMQIDPETGKEVPRFRNDWAAFMFKASETGILSKKELQDALSDMGRSKYAQEFECSFDAIVEGAIFGPELERLRELSRVTNLPVHPNLPVHTAWDLGWHDMTAIWFYQQIGEEYRFIDYLEINHQSIPEIARALEAKRYRYGVHLLPHDVEVSELGTGKSRRTILNENGIRVTTVPRVKIKMDAISAAQAALPLCYFDESRTADGLDGLALYRREKDDRLGRLREAPVHDWSSHPADAFMTFALGRRKAPGSYYGNHNHHSAEI
jgi:hypothetical protein